MKTGIALTALALALCGCGTFGGPKGVPSSSELVGEYVMGDGLGVCMVVELAEDGSLQGRECSGEHMNDGSREFDGSWSQVGERLFFETPLNDIGEAEAFYWNRAPAFVEVEYKRKGDKVHEMWVFRKQTSEP